MKYSYEYDQDPRYGWHRLVLEEGDSKEFILVDEGGLHYGFTFSDGKLEPTCICSAWSESECACANVSWQT